MKFAKLSSTLKPKLLNIKSNFFYPFHKKCFNKMVRRNDKKIWKIV